MYECFEGFVDVLRSDVDHEFNDEGLLFVSKNCVDCYDITGSSIRIIIEHLFIR